jgi:hypothetical protein
MKELPKNFPKWSVKEMGSTQTRFWDSSESPQNQQFLNRRKQLQASPMTQANLTAIRSQTP